LSLLNCKLLDIPLIKERRGDISFIDSNKHIPFEIKRIYYIYDVPKDQVRGSHAHKELRQFLICISGVLEINIDDGFQKRNFTLDDPSKGLLIEPVVWKDIKFLEDNSVCLCLVNEYFSEADYLRTYNDFKKYIDSNQ
tara:strand:- start:2000 stop:2413 length:414 start_codon:yes stop_codon:yes gene_type:complete